MFDRAPHFTARDGRLCLVLPDGSEVPYWSTEEGRVTGRVAEVPEDEFEEAIESDDPPSVTALVEERV